MTRRQSDSSLKGRIAFAILVIVVVPIVLAAAIFYFFTNYKVNQIGEKYGIENPTYASIYSNATLISRRIQEEYARIHDIMDTDPKSLEDISVLADLNEEMSDNDAFIAARKGGEIYYNGSPSLTDQELLQELPPFRNPEVTEDSNFSIQTGDRAMLRQIDFWFSDGERGSIFLISPTDRILPEIRSWAAELVFLVVVALAIISAAMGIWLYRGIMRPLGNLKKAAQNVRDGNLDFQVKRGGVQEIDELSGDFEEMRVRLKESAEEKVEFDRENRELISNISHDLKTPLTTIRGYVEGIMDGVANTPEKLDRYMLTIRGKVGEMTRLLDELTLYSQIDTNKIPYTFARKRVEDCFESCVSDIRIDLEERGIDLEFADYAKPGTEVVVDSEQLRRVISNIINNAVKYMDKEKGRIRIRLRDVGDFVQAEIEDNGRGIAKEELPRIFDRFYRTDASRNTKQGGSGIGLSIVRKIVEDHGGRVWAISKEGDGTTICFTLRKYSETKGETAPVQEKKRRRSSRKRGGAK